MIRIWSKFRKLPNILQGCIISGIFLLISTLIIVFGPTCLHHLGKVKTPLRLIDVTINDEGDEFPKVDFKLQNIGDQIIFIKMAEFHVTKVYRVIYPGFPGEVPISRNYEVFLPPRNTPYVESVDISQAIKPNDVDRFAFTLGYLENSITPIIYNIYIELIYNETNKRLRTSSLIFVMPPSSTPLAMVFLPLRTTVDADKQNNLIVSEVSKLKGIKTKAVIKLVDYLTEYGFEGIRKFLIEQ